MNRTADSLLSRFWHSPVVMTWGGMASRILGLLVLLPLVMNRFAAEETAVWFLFSTVLSMQLLVEFGFTATFVRFVAYANKSAVVADGQAAPEYAMDTVIANMRYVYARLTMLWTAAVFLLGSVALARPIAAVASPSDGWVAWIILAASSSFCFRVSMYVAFLQGKEQVAVHQRWEALISVSTVLLCCVVLLNGGGLISLVICNQLGALARLMVYQRLSRHLAGADAWRHSDNSMVNTLWAAAWRSGLGVLATFGTIQVSGLLYAQVAPARELAAYMLALQLIQRLRLFAYVPFSARIPSLSRLYAEQNREALLGLSNRAMILCIWLFLFAALCIGFSGDYLLRLIGSNTTFVAPTIWWLMALAFMIDMIGAIHLQLYSTTNRIVWHVANGVSGAIMLALMPFTYHWLGLVGIPLAMLAGFALFYTPYSMWLSYRAFDIRVSAASALSLVLPTAILVALLAATIWRG